LSTATGTASHWRWWIAGVAMVLGVAAIVWASDRVTVQGERVLYGVDCDGQWRDLACVGKLKPGARYAFRASPRRREVIAWTIGSERPSRTYSGCQVVGRDQWSCPVRTSAGSDATLTMSKHGLQCAPAPAAPAARVIAKWKWYLLGLGVDAFSRPRTIAHPSC